MKLKDIINELRDDKTYQVPCDPYGHASEYLSCKDTITRLNDLNDWWSKQGLETEFSLGNEVKNLPVWNRDFFVYEKKDVVVIMVENKKIKEFNPYNSFPDSGD